MTMIRKLLTNWGRVLLLVPVILLILFAFVIPLLAILPEALGGSASERFLRIYESPVYLKIVWTTVRISLEATVLTLLVSFPLAWILSRSTGLKALFLGLLVLVPFLTSILVRTFAWVAILGHHGFVNATLLSLGLISTPLPLLFSESAVVLALVHSSIPMMVFALVPVLRRFDERILLAAHTLGASPVRAWMGTVIPIAIKGIQSGVTITFLFTMASFVAPAFLGNQRQQMLAQVIQSEIETGSDWAFAAALGITLALTATIVVMVISFTSRYMSRWQHPIWVPTVMPVLQAHEVDIAILRQPLVQSISHLHVPAIFLFGRHLAAPAYLTLMSVFILLPLVVLIPISFSAAEVLVFPPPAYSTRWFESVLSNPLWVDSAYTSLRIGAATAVLSLLLATLTALGFGRRLPFHGTAEAIVLSPLTIPSVVYALGAYLIFSRLGLVDSELGIIIAHTVLIYPVAYLVANSTYNSIDPALSRAASSLGANPWTQFRTIIFPLLLPGLAIGAMLAMLLSFDESVASIFLSNLSVRTLPRMLWEGIRFNSSPEPAAVSVMLLALTCVVAFIGMTFFYNRNKN